MIVLDTTRADRLSAYGNPRPTTPNLDALAARGVLFTDVTAAGPWTWPSHGSLFTGEPPWVHGAHCHPDEESPDLQHMDASLSALRTDLPTLAEDLSAAGWRAVSFGANPLLDPTYGLTRGFERAEHISGERGILVEALREIRRADGPLFLFVNFMRVHHPAIAEGDAPWAREAYRRYREGDLPAWMAGYRSESPPGLNFYQGKKKADTISGFDPLRRGALAAEPAGQALWRDLYDADLRAVDVMVGELLAAWGDRGPVVLTADHGEYFGEHGLWEHGRTLRAPILEVPLIVAAEGLPAGARVDAPVESMSVRPTVLELVGLGPRERSLLPVIRGEAPGPVRAAAWPDRRLMKSVGPPYDRGWRLYREGDHALVVSTAGEALLFDLGADPDMDRDLAAAEPERRARLRQAMDAAIPASAFEEAEALLLSEEQAAQLRAMGYVE